jgi:hypothetical protein
LALIFFFLVMEFTHIYWGWKRDILSLMMSNLDPWSNPEGSQPLA